MDHLKLKSVNRRANLLFFMFKVLITVFLVLGMSTGRIKPHWVVRAAPAFELRKELQLVLPEYIDDPNYKVVFKNPSKNPIEITVDGKTYKDVKSPFKLPGLSVGKHRIIFKFTNKQGVLRVLPLDIVVVPRGVRFAKGLKTLVYQPEPLVVSGTGTPRSEVLLIINGLEHKLLKVAIDGKWTYTIPNPKLGTYTFLAFAIKDGIINPKPVKLVVDYKPKHPITRTQPSSGAQKKSFTQQVRDYIKENSEYFYAGLLGLASMSVAYLVVRLRRYLREKQEEKTLAELLGLDDDKTIVEVLSSTNAPRKQSKKTKKSEKKRVKKSTKSRVKSKKSSRSSKKKSLDLLVSKKVLTKEEFLKKFKKKGDKS